MIYDNNSIDQKLLYVAITRAMHELYINYNGEVSLSLKKLLEPNNIKLVKTLNKKENRF